MRPSFPMKKTGSDFRFGKMPVLMCRLFLPVYSGAGQLSEVAQSLQLYRGHRSYDDRAMPKRKWA